MRQTFKERGISQGDNNPASRKTLMKSGLSPSEIENWLSEKSKKGGRTKKKNGYYDDKSNNPFSTDFWIKQGLNSEQAAEKVNSRIHNKPEFWIARGYSHDKAIVLAGSSADTNSLKAKMEKWGDDGLTKYLETKQKLSDSWTPRSQSGQKFGSSRQANVFFKKLYKFCRKLGYDRDQIYCDLNGKEYFLTHGENIFFYDFTLKPSNVIIEFNGEHVHPNKDLLSEEEWNKWKHAYSKKSANDVFGRDQLKLNTAASNGFSTLTVWSKDPNILELAQNFIRSKS